jgi:hypothetical protein
MAITKIIKIKANPKAAIKYITNPAKTEDSLLVSYSGCSKENADVMFNLALMNKDRKHKKDEVLAYHFIQSFSPTDDITPEKAHELGMKFMERTFEGKYAFVCSTHIDKGHIHNHFVMCASERAMTGRKLNDNLALLHQIQRNSDELCREYSLSTIERKQRKGKNYKEWIEDKNSPEGSNKTRLRKLIDKTIMEAKDFDDFIERLKSANIEIGNGNSKKYGTVTKYKFPEEKNFHRGYSLGKFYTDDNIQKRITRHNAHLESQKAKQEERKAKKKAAYDAMTPGEKILDKGKLKIKSIRDTAASEISRNKNGLNRWTNIQNARRMQEIQKLLHDRYGIDYTSVKGHISEIKADNNRISADIQSSKKQIDELRQFIADCTTYRKLRIYDKNMEKSPNPESYYQEHDTLIDAYHDALFALEQRRINPAEITVERIKIMQNCLEQAELEVKKLEEQQRQNEREMQELQGYQKEIEVYTGQKRERI